MSEPVKDTAVNTETGASGVPVTQEVSSESPVATNAVTKEEPLLTKNSTTSDEKLFSEDNSGLIKVDNILANLTQEEAMNKGREYAKIYGLDVELFAKGAAVARTPHNFGNMEFLTTEEHDALKYESEHRWRAVPKELYNVIIMCSVAAAVQGMDESVTNGANLFWPYVLGIGSDSKRDTWLLGLVNSAPYLCCSTIGCWLTDPLNRLLGRRGTILATCFVSLWCCFWMGFVDSWYHLLVARFFLGFGIGPKSATVPVYAAETTPANIRGALVMMWQLWTAFGIMLGTTFSLAFFYVDNPDGLSHQEFANLPHKISKGLNWRLMLGSALLPAIVVCAQVMYCPESPRWLMGREKHKEAYESYNRLRKHEILAARDCFYQYCLLLEEESYNSGKNMWWKVKQLFGRRRNRNAAAAATLVMFGQQFCAINVVAYYSSSIFSESGFSTIHSLVASWGFGMLNTVFAIPALFSIDRFGRKFLLMLTFPLMGVFLLLAGFAFWIPEEHKEARVGVIALGIYLFTIAYSVGEGPVPFTYSAEVFPLYIRDLGMSLATATCWFFNFVLAITWPSMLKAFKPQGAFGWYAAWNFILFCLITLFMRETKNYTLEELDYVFDVPMAQFSPHEVKSYWRKFQVYVLRRKLSLLPPLHAQSAGFGHTNADDKVTGKHVEYV